MTKRPKPDFIGLEPFLLKRQKTDIEVKKPPLLENIAEEIKDQDSCSSRSEDDELIDINQVAESEN